MLRRQARDRLDRKVLVRKVPVTVIGPVPAPTGTVAVIVFPPETLATAPAPLNSTRGVVPKL